MGEGSRVDLAGPLAPYGSGFAEELARRGYRPRPAEMQLRLMGEVSIWLAREGLVLSALTPEAVSRFLAERRRAGCTRYVSAGSLVRLLGFLRGLGVVPEPAEPVRGPVEEMLERYRRYLLVERGLGEPTLKGYVHAVRPFVADRLRGDQLDVEGVTAADVTGFVVGACAGRSPRVLVTALRSLLRFWHLDELVAVPLAGSVPSVASWRLGGLPRPLRADEIRRLLASCDRGTVIGQRDYAMLVLLARMGLRAGEVARLGLDDIDWRAGEIVVRGKGPNQERLPLPADVGEAIADYLRRGRPPTAGGRTVFVRVVAPLEALTAGGVTQAVFAAAHRAELGPMHAHRLRHSAASEMLRAGASLGEIGQVLRHRRMLTTAIYAKVDHEALRTIARPWPGSGQ